MENRTEQSAKKDHNTRKTSQYWRLFELFVMPGIEQLKTAKYQQSNNIFRRYRPPWFLLTWTIIISLDIFLSASSIRDIFRDISMKNIIIFLLMIFCNLFIIVMFYLIYRKYQDKRKKKKVHNAGS